MMYLINFKALIQQILPVSWRDSWRESLAQVFVKPFMLLYDDLHAYKIHVRNSAYSTPQLIVFETLLSERMGMRIFVTQSNTAFTFIVRAPSSMETNDINKLENLVLRYKLAGTNHQITRYT